MVPWVCGTYLIAQTCTDLEPFVTLDFFVDSKNSKIMGNKYKGNYTVLSLSIA